MRPILWAILILFLMIQCCPACPREYSRVGMAPVLTKHRNQCEKYMSFLEEQSARQKQLTETKQDRKRRHLNQTMNAAAGPSSQPDPYNTTAEPSSHPDVDADRMDLDAPAPLATTPPLDVLVPLPTLPPALTRVGRPSQRYRLPKRFRDILPEAPAPVAIEPPPPEPEPAIRRVILHVRDSMDTALNRFRIFRHYPHCPSYDPDSHVDTEDLANFPLEKERLDSLTAEHVAESTPPPPPWPFANMTKYNVMSWLNTGSNQKSEAETTCFIDEVIHAPDFSPEDLWGFSAHRENQLFDKASSDKVPWTRDGWKELQVEIEIPLGVKNEATHPFTIPGLHRRSIVEVIKSAFADVSARDFHLTPFKRLVKSAAGVITRAYDEGVTCDHTGQGVLPVPKMPCQKEECGPDGNRTRPAVSADSGSNILLDQGFTIGSNWVEGILKEFSLVPTANAFAELLRPYGAELFPMLVIDLLHEFELGVWKAVFTHLIRVLYTLPGAAVAEFNERFRMVPTFGTDTIRHITSDASNRKKLVARDYEDYLQTIIPVIEGLLHKPYNSMVLTMLFRLAEWHALAKLRMHTVDTAARFDKSTVVIGRELQAFPDVTRDKFETKELPGVEVPHHISPSRNHRHHLIKFVHENEEDPAKKDFISKLKDHLLGRLLQHDFDGDEEGFSDEDRTTVRILGQHIYSAKLLRVNYTTYDMHRDQDSINPRTHPDVMVLSPETGPNAHPFWYARVLGVFHTEVLHTGARSRYNAAQWMEFLWVRWLGVEPSYRSGFKVAWLPKVGFVPEEDVNAFGFLDPSLVLRACHLVPAFAGGRTSELLKTVSPTTARPLNETDDWEKFYVTIWVDRDMFMRYIGGGIGHISQATALPADDLDLDQEDELTASPGVAGPDTIAVQQQEPPTAPRSPDASSGSGGTGPSRPPGDGDESGSESEEDSDKEDRPEDSEEEDSEAEGEEEDEVPEDDDGFAQL
ncbi:hypothetical protein C8R44DRAFT_726491 [Mycena epipterygia]|nr:hypothetical protein C8R44DRAFT_726491 [Mycena epipterygia]